MFFTGKKISLLFITLLLIVGCSELNNPSTVNKVHNNKLTPFYGERGVDNQWPPTNTAATIEDSLSMKNYYIIMDGSGSMASSACGGGSSKIKTAKTAVKRFIDKLPDDANIGLLVFDQNGVSERVPLKQNNKNSARKAVDRIVADNGTPLNSSMVRGYRALVNQSQKQLGYGEYHLVVVTDGEASSNEDPRRTVQEIAHASPVVIHAIGFCLDSNHSLNQEGIVLYKSASNPQALTQGLDAILSESEEFAVTEFGG